MQAQFSENNFPVLILSAAELHWNKPISTLLYCTNIFSAVGPTDTYADKLKATP